MTKSKMFAIRMPDEVRKALSHASAQSGKDVTAIVLEAIDLYLSRSGDQSDALVSDVCAATKANADLSGRRRSSILDSLREEGAID